MAKNRTQLHMLAYDISMDPKRLAEVHRTVRRWGIPLQYSVFLVPATPAKIDALLAELDAIIDPQTRRHPRLSAPGQGRYRPARPRHR